MLRLGKDFGWTVVLAAGVLIPVRNLPAQSATPTPPGMTPQATAAQNPSPTNGAAAKPSTTPSSKARARHKKAQADPVAEIPQPPPPPPTLEQTPPTAPRITYQDGQLSIDAHNSTLSQVLRAVQLQTGASMEMPSSANNERVVTQLGPGQPKDVLNSLLNGSKFDYIILGVTGNPGAVQRVILTPRQNQGTNNVNVAQNNQVPNQEPVDDEAQPDESIPVPEVEAENPTPDQQPPPPPGGFRRPMMIPPGQQDPSQAAGNGDTPNGVKTPEQLMQELQQMQQQQQQYQQQLNPANQNPQQ